MPDNRRQKRVPLAAIARINVEDAGKVRAVEAFTADISMSGIGLYSATAIDIDKDVSVVVEFMGADGLPKTDSIRGHVVYYNSLGIKYFIGIEFSEHINPFQQPFLFERLQRILAWD